jgi:hypothetical protein
VPITVPKIEPEPPNRLVPRQDAGYLIDPAVDGDHRDVRVDGLLEGRRHGVYLVRADDDAVDALGNGGFNIGRLLGRGNLAVAFDHGDVAEFLGLGLHLVHHVDEERECQPWDRLQNGERFVGLRRGAGG